MSSPIVNDNGNLSTPKVKPGASIFFNRDGTITGKAGYTYNAAATGVSFSIGAAHPYDADCYLAQFGLTWDAAGFVEMDGDYVGVWSTTVVQVDGIAAGHQEPIETNPNFGTIATTANGASFDQNTGFFQGWIPIGQPNAYPGTDPNIKALVGIQAYLACGLVVRITSSTTDSSDVTSALGNLGVAFDNLTAGLISYSYTYYAFLCTNVTYKEVPIGVSAATFTLSSEYTFTPPNGWNPLIYPTR